MLFQVHFLSLLLEERGAGDLGAVAEHCSQKLIRRHPHVFGETQADNAAAVLRNWDAIKRHEEGHGTEADGPPESLPATIYARKVQRRAAAAGDPQPDVEKALALVVEEARRLAGTPSGAAGPDDEARGDAHSDAGATGAGPRSGPAGPAEPSRPGEAVRSERFDALGELLYAAVAAARELGVDAELALRAAAGRRRARAETTGRRAS